MWCVLLNYSKVSHWRGCTAFSFSWYWDTVVDDHIKRQNQYIFLIHVSVASSYWGHQRVHHSLCKFAQLFHCLRMKAACRFSTNIQRDTYMESNFSCKYCWRTCIIRFFAYSQMGKTLKWWHYRLSTLQIKMANFSSSCVAWLLCRACCSGGFNASSHNTCIRSRSFSDQWLNRIHVAWRSTVMESDGVVIYIKLLHYINGLVVLHVRFYNCRL